MDGASTYNTVIGLSSKKDFDTRSNGTTNPVCCVPKYRGLKEVRDMPGLHFCKVKDLDLQSSFKDTFDNILLKSLQRKPAQRLTAKDENNLIQDALSVTVQEFSKTMSTQFTAYIVRPPTA
ncbi:hypothetical protein Q5752_006972 [Cryptotrichosporon argae]